MVTDVSTTIIIHMDFPDVTFPDLHAGLGKVGLMDMVVKLLWQKYQQS